VKLYHFLNNLVVPDVDFQSGPVLPIAPTDGKGNDIVRFSGWTESLANVERSTVAIQKLHNAIPDGKDLSFTIVDWHSRLTMFWNYLCTDTAIQLLSLGKVVI
jgi:hypothetical protein